MMHTTNYSNTFIQIAEDCPVTTGDIPPLKVDSKTVANLQFEMIAHHPYQFTSDDVVFGVYATKNNIAKKDLNAEREKFFSKGQPCLRSSPLAKRYGWGFHHNADGKVALFAVDSKQYKKFKNDASVKQTKAMRSKKA